jgi:hypothetical protein
LVSLPNAVVFTAQDPTLLEVSVKEAIAGGYYPYFIPLLISSIMVTDLALVGTGRRGIAGVLGLVHRAYPMPKRLGK